MDTAQLKKVYKETIAPALQKQFNYSSAMEIPVLKFAISFLEYVATAF